MSEPNFPMMHVDEVEAHAQELPDPSFCQLGTTKKVPLEVTKHITTDFRWTNPRRSEEYTVRQELRFRVVHSEDGRHVWRIVNSVYL